MSNFFSKKVNGKTIEKTSTDHLPIVAELKSELVQQKKFKTIKKRCMKDFTKEKWILNLAGKKWEDLGRTDDVEDMALIFGNLIEDSLNECAPWKETKVRTKHVFTFISFHFISFISV